MTKWGICGTYLQERKGLWQFTSGTIEANSADPDVTYNTADVARLYGVAAYAKGDISIELAGLAVIRRWQFGDCSKVRR